MHADLAAIERELRDIEAHARGLVESVDEATWVTRPTPDSWSMSECLAHLTLSTNAFLPAVREELARPEVRARQAPAHMRRDFMGWALSRMMEPPVRSKFPTSAAFIPGGDATRAAALAAFVESQAVLIGLLHDSDGIDITQVRVTSPFNARVKYSLFSMFRITTAHQRRHLWQAEQARDAMAASSSTG